ncbi:MULTISPECIES: DUF948 domain-containing protein [Fructobacillus]|jgi:uncharacterized protein YoxC|uniref:Contains an MCP-like domain n=2 Tax=Fructobacillus TaxID=559173 RepID=A0A3F3HA42_9LACO|nr:MULTISPECIES: DUF948 domain-containing protein [Fructobacillus]KMK54151.1 hypothetical protein FEFB_01230 [Fructobacillus sp. EFB-N1]MCK8627674.1 DUF948 domain-containing protein [Fructobacillus cardui]CAK1239062.1 Uncharacterized conserved protein YoxC [Fructobacillus tropaeoli]CAK1239258.1 Uncharacterized conserved protein YoxC [Fructobacillus cardui]CAK1242984.1 Uncharacterized conserved protein YoxC [Fructobacillus cardui]
MTIGELSILIFALAFLLLVVFIGIFLLRLTRSVSILTTDIDTIARSSNEVLANTNMLLDDVNDKMATLDVTVQAAADLSQTVSDLNGSVRKASNNLAGMGTISKAGATLALSKVFGLFSKKNKK